MILDRLVTFIKHYPPRVMQQWKSFSKDISLRQDILKLRYINTELGEYPFVLLIEQILQNCEEHIVNLINIKDGFSRCVYLMEPKVNFFIEQRLDNIRNQPFFRRTFMLNGIDNNKSPIEIVIPVMEKDPLMNLPLMNFELSEWEKVKPIRIWYYNSNELVSNFVVDPRVKFRKEVASFGIITVDMISLILKYVNYIENNIYYPGILRTFLKEEVFIHFHEDVIEIFMINLIIRLLECKDEKELIKISDEYKSNSLNLGGMYNYFYDLFHELQQMKEGKISSLQLLYSNLLMNRSIMDRVSDNLNHTRLRNLRQYYHNQLLIDLIDMKLLLLFIKYSSNKPFVNSIKTQFENKLNLMIKTNIINQYRSKTIKNYVINELKVLSDLLK